MMSKMVDAEKQGSLFAVVFSLETLCDVSAGVLFNSVYAATLDTFAPTVFLLMVAMYTANIVLLV